MTKGKKMAYSLRFKGGEREVWRFFGDWFEGRGQKETIIFQQ